MSGIISFLRTFSIGGIIMGAVYTLVPEKSFKKPVTFVLCICFICIIIFSLPGLSDFDFSYDYDIFTEQNDTVNEQTAVLTVKNALSIANIEYSDIRITFDKNENGEIVFIYVDVYTSESVEKVKKALESENIKVSVIND